MKTFVTGLILIWSLVLLTACPTRSKLERAFNESARVASLAETAAVTTGDFYRAHLIDIDTKDRIAGALEKVVKNGREFHQLLVGLKSQYGDLTDAPPDILTNLDLVFSTQVIAPFLAIMTSVGSLPPETAQKILVTIAVLKSAILTIAGVFNRGTASYQFYLKNAEVNANA